MQAASFFDDPIKGYWYLEFDRSSLKNKPAGFSALSVFTAGFSVLKGTR